MDWTCAASVAVKTKVSGWTIDIGISRAPQGAPSLVAEPPARVQARRWGWYRGDERGFPGPERGARRRGRRRAQGHLGCVTREDAVTPANLHGHGAKSAIQRSCSAGIERSAAAGGQYGSIG